MSARAARQAKGLQAPSPSETGPRPTGHFPLSDREFARISERLEAQTGIGMGPDKHTLVHARIQKRIRALRLSSFSDYCDYLESEAGEKEQSQFVNALTTNLTSFFRESHHFKHLVEEALAPLVSGVRKGERLRLWSAGCSTGEEPLCIAMMLSSILPRAADYDARILATDIDSNVLTTGHRAIYPQDRMKGIPAELLSQFFESDGSGDEVMYRANDALRKLISHRKFNLNAKHWPMRGKFDVIFCRNTLIYFDDNRQREILEGFRDRLKPGGYLYLGHSERLSGSVESRFERVGVTIFKAVD